MIYQQEFCSYYGKLDYPLIGDNIGVYIVDQAFQRLLEKYEVELKINQRKLLKTLKDSFKEDISSFKSKMDKLNKRFTLIEKELSLLKKVHENEKSEAIRDQKGTCNNNEKSG